MTSNYPPKLRWSIPGLYGGPGDDCEPEAGSVVLSNGVPVESLTIGKVAGRPVRIETTDPLWLQSLIDAAAQAQARLAEWRTRPASAA